MGGNGEETMTMASPFGMMILAIEDHLIIDVETAAHDGERERERERERKRERGTVETGWTR